MHDTASFHDTQHFPDDGKYANTFPVEYPAIIDLDVMPLQKMHDWFMKAVNASDSGTIGLNDFELGEIVAFLPYVSLVNVELDEDGHIFDYKIRITSQTLERLFGMLPNSSAKEAFPPSVYERWRYCFERTLSRKMPVYACSSVMGVDRTFRHVDALFLPLRGSDKNNALIISVNHVDWTDDTLPYMNASQLPQGANLQYQPAL